jgi:UDP-N-acetylmuramate dehydrogenase
MKVLKNADLKGFSTMRLVAEGAVVYEPENAEELGQVLRSLRGRKIHLLGAGSNVVFAERVETPIVGLMRVDDRIENLGGGRFRAGCSVRIQRLIRDAQKAGFGGIEYLFSLPASVGGCVVMNAGRGRGPAIADVLEEVELMDRKTGEIRKEPVDRTVFGHRLSPYQSNGCVVLSAILRLAEQPPEETERRIHERLETSRKHLDAGLPSCGSVFHRGNRWLFQGFRLLHPRSGGLAFSAKTSNWIGNRGGGTLSDFKRLVGKVQHAHRLIGQSCELEIRMFE